ncbi:MAG: ABC transporter permease [Nitrospiraceae bacterium]|nr:ABC transporter permease [Nitrospiraceae bacterium]
MKLYIAKRLLLLLPLLTGITLITFLLTKALPGDPVYGLVGERSSPEIIEKIRKEMGADKGIIRQYAGYVSLLAGGELGRSYYTNRKVSEDILDKFPNTLRLAIGAMILSVPAGIALGLLSALRKDSVTDRLISGVTISFLSVPVFWSGLILMLIASLWLRLVPPSGTGDIRYMILPCVTLALPSLATVARVTRAGVLGVYRMPYVRTARAKGLTKARITALHITRNALIPVITIIGLDFAGYLNGAVLTETIFGWDGIGRFTMEGIMKRDYPVIMGCIITGTTVFVLVNIIMDIAYHVVDPRVRLHAKDR